MALHLLSVYDPWGLKWIVVNGKERCTSKDNMTKTSDQITLILNYDDSLIQFEHHRTDRLVHLPIDPHRCPLPWATLVELLNQNDGVRILQGLSRHLLQMTVDKMEKSNEFDILMFGT